MKNFLLSARRYFAAFVLTVTAIALSGCGGSANGVRSGKLQEVIPLESVTPLAHPIGPINRVIVAGDAGAAYIYTDQKWATEGKVVLLRVQPENGRADTVVLNIPQDSGLDRRGALADVAVDKDHVALLFWRALLIFKRSGVPLAEQRPLVVPLRYPYKRVGLVRGRCFVALCNLAAREYGDHYAYAAEVDLNAGAVKWETPLPDPDGFQFTSFIPRRVLAFVEGGVLVSDLTRYRIMLYDSLGRSLSTLTRGIPAWEEQYDSSFRQFRPLTGKVPYNMKGLLDTLRPYLSRLYMIRLIDAVDDSTLLVAWQSPRKHESGRLKGLEKVYYDVWRRRGGAWALDVADVPDFNPQMTDSFAVHRAVPLLWEYWSLGQSKIAVLDPLPPMDLRSKTYDDIRKAVDSAAVEGEPPFSLIQFKVAR